MPANAKDNPATRHNTRKRNGSISIPEEYQDIKNSQEGRKFLEKHMLLCPPGEPATNTAISYCLHQISGMARVPKQVVNAVRATAFLLEEIEEMAVNETVRSAFDSQLTEFTADMKLLAEDVNTKIDNHLKAVLDQIEKAASKIPPPTATTGASEPTRQATTTIPSYASALVKPSPNADPKLAAREGIKSKVVSPHWNRQVKARATRHTDAQGRVEQSHKGARAHRGENKINLEANRGKYPNRSRLRCLGRSEEHTSELQFTP